jgi:hypothetical protein
LSKEFSNDVQKIIYVSYLRDLTDKDLDIQTHLLQTGFKQSKSRSFSGVGEVITYEK